MGGNKNVNGMDYFFYLFSDLEYEKLNSIHHKEKDVEFKLLKINKFFI